MLQVEDLVVATGSVGREVKLVDGVSLQLGEGAVVGVVGAAGSGKSVLVRAILGLLPSGVRVLSGRVIVRGVETTFADRRAMRDFRGKVVAPILPDAKRQLNPLMSIGTFMRSVVLAHAKVSKEVARDRSLQALRAAGSPDPERVLASFPHELSGGMAQRVCIALALLHQPKLLIADEPTFGLDVTVQRQVLDRLAVLGRETGMSQLIVTRDLGIVAQYCQEVCVMSGGRVVEAGLTGEIFAHPRSPYTAALLKAVGVATPTSSADAAPVVA